MRVYQFRHVGIVLLSCYQVTTIYCLYSVTADFCYHTSLWCFALD